MTTETTANPELTSDTMPSSPIILDPVTKLETAITSNVLTDTLHANSLPDFVQSMDMIDQEENPQYQDSYQFCHRRRIQQPSSKLPKTHRRSRSLPSTKLDYSTLPPCSYVPPSIPTKPEILLPPNYDSAHRLKPYSHSATAKIVHHNIQSFLDFQSDNPDSTSLEPALPASKREGPASFPLATTAYVPHRLDFLLKGNTAPAYKPDPKPDDSIESVMSVLSLKLGSKSRSSRRIKVDLGRPRSPQDSISMLPASETANPVPPLDWPAPPPPPEDNI